MPTLIAAALAFAALHLLVSGTGLRGVLVARLGAGPYRGLFSLATVGTLVFVRRSYSHAFATDNQYYWVLPYAQHMAAPIMLVAVFFAVAGLSTPSPTAVGQEKLLAQGAQPRGIQHVTRHPFLWGVALWATFHLAANGDAASLVLFATFLIVALLGTRSIDRKRERALGDAWRSYAARTSNLPFLALAQGRTQLAWREIGWWRPLLALVVFGALVSLHPLLFHAYPMPGMND
ncbi:MAG TPA: NnrU family protein [Polyangiales bacterium]|nr:NnrU family protein [Polyangiales bacterium]